MRAHVKSVQSKRKLDLKEHLNGPLKSRSWFCAPGKSYKPNILVPRQNSRKRNYFTSVLNHGVKNVRHRALLPISDNQHFINFFYSLLPFCVNKTKLRHGCINVSTDTWSIDSLFAKLHGKKELVELIWVHNTIIRLFGEKWTNHNFG